MATWQDGPEYAPRERPAAFVTPPAAPLAAPAPAPAPAPVTPPPDAEPSFVPPSGAQPDLATLVPAAAPGRNPNMAFDVAAATITSGGSWSARQATGTPGESGTRPPTEPFVAPGPPLSGYLPPQATVQPNAQVNPARFPAANTPQWFAPPPSTRVPDAPPQVTIAQIWRAATPGVLIPLIIGALFSWLSILMLALSFALSARIPYRRIAVRRSYMAGLVVIGFNGVLALFEGSDPDVLFSALSGAAQLACFILPFVVGLIVGAALRAGERPDRIG